MNLKEENSINLAWLAKRIKSLRSECGLTQLQFLHETNIHIGRIEQGKRDISFTTLCKICDYFKISLEDFFANERLHKKNHNS